MSTRPPELENTELVANRVKPILHTRIPRPDNDTQHPVGIQFGLPMIKAALGIGPIERGEERIGQ